MNKTLVSFALLVGCNGPNDDSDAVTGDPCEEPGNICVWMGLPNQAQFGGENTDRLDTYLYLPVDISFASDGTAYFPDYNNHRVRKVDPSGMVTTVSGTGFLGDGPNTSGSTVNCWAGCDSMLSAWNHPTDVVVNPANENELYIAAWHNSRLNKIDLSTNTMYWVAGSGGRNYVASDDLTLATMDLPSAVAVAPNGTVYIADQANHMIRRLTSAGVLEDVAGEPRHAGYDGDGGPAIDAHLHGHTDQKADPGSKLVMDGKTLYVADTVNGIIRTIDHDTLVIDHFAGKYTSAGPTTYVDAVTGVSYEADSGSVPGYSGDGGPATDAVFNTPRDLAVGIEGELYIADTKNHCVRVVRDGVVDRFAGQCGAETGFGGEGGPALDAQFTDVFGVAVDPDGNVYIADTNNQVIWRVKR
jgi:hypothetical protein